ncbi:hypothetical protein L493_2693 [Bordetella bronchiseptica 99-R-0433]|uniref:PliI family lysozyme inhibitor of I-type lysozyme n=1 Tax=Bordetella bronchiseptica TaxID=518 RepID=UPI00045B3349|nr:PliI family lysozyme inhibitor of I-type lysozyme [Bordetella bronchiseptica]KCV67060.1 hypothetical protein L493_2693 [Bordetella bronchiseptica 99-R-0433]
MPSCRPRIVLASLAVLLALPATHALAAPSGAAPCPPAAQAVSAPLPGGGAVVVSNGACEPASIGSYVVSRYDDLDTGAFRAGLAIARDGVLVDWALDERHGRRVLRLVSETAGSGAYRNTQYIELTGDGGLRLLDRP